MSSYTRMVCAVAACVAAVGIIAGCAEAFRAPETIAAANAKRDAEIDAKARAMAESNLAQWKRKNPELARSWIDVEKASHKIKPPADNSYILEGGQGKGHSYGNYTERDLVIWDR